MKLIVRLQFNMTTLAKKCFVNLNGLKQCRGLCYANYNGEQSNRFKRRNVQRRSEDFVKTIQWRQFHVTAFNQKIVSFKLSDIGEGIREVVIKEWFVKVGDNVQQFDNICEVQSDKAAVTITSRYDGVIAKIHHDVNHTALVGQTLVDIEVQEDEDQAPSEQADTATMDTVTDDVVDSSQTYNQRRKTLTTPAVRRIASQFKVDLSTVKASGRHGRVLKEDLLSHLNITSDKSNEVPSVAQEQNLPLNDVIPTNGDRTIPVTGFTKAMVKSMTEAMKIPHFVFSDEYNVTKLVQAREELKPLGLEKGVKLTFMPFIIKAASLCLAKYPIINSSLDSSCENITYKSNHNIGVAMDTPNGLVVPVIKSVQHKSILEVALELSRLQERGSKGQLGLGDLSGGTFTLSNIGIVGGTYTKPIIFPPQVSIGALGKIQVLPRFDTAGNVVKAHILSVSWSADHRVVDGVTMARYSEQLKKYLENPYLLLLDL